MILDLAFPALAKLLRRNLPIGAAHCNAMMDDLQACLREMDAAGILHGSDKAAKGPWSFAGSVRLDEHGTRPAFLETVICQSASDKNNRVSLEFTLPLPADGSLPTALFFELVCHDRRAAEALGEIHHDHRVFVDFAFDEDDAECYLGNDPLGEGVGHALLTAVTRKKYRALALRELVLADPQAETFHGWPAQALGAIALYEAVFNLLAGRYVPIEGAEYLLDILEALERPNSGMQLQFDAGDRFLLGANPGLATRQ